MRVEVNGVERDILPETRLVELLAQLHLAPERVAVERNLSIVHRKDFDLVLQERDKLEIIHFVGGGD